MADNKDPWKSESKPLSPTNLFGFSLIGGIASIFFGPFYWFYYIYIDNYCDIKPIYKFLMNLPPLLDKLSSLSPRMLSFQKNNMKSNAFYYKI